MNKSLPLDKRAPGSLNMHENKTIRPLLCGMLTPFSRVQCFKCDGKMLAYDIEYCDWLMLLWRGKRILTDNDIICAFWLFVQASWKDFRECPLANSIKQNWQREGTEADSQEECANSKHVTWRTGHTLSSMTRAIPFQGRISFQWCTWRSIYKIDCPRLWASHIWGPNIYVAETPTLNLGTIILRLPAEVTKLMINISSVIICHHCSRGQDERENINNIKNAVEEALDENKIFLSKSDSILHRDSKHNKCILV